MFHFKFLNEISEFIFFEIFVHIDYRHSKQKQNCKREIKYVFWSYKTDNLPFALKKKKSVGAKYI